MNLYRVILRGMKSEYGTSYCVATDPNSAYNIVREFVDRNQLGFLDDRALDKIELIAEAKRYPDCKIILHGLEYERYLES